MPAQNSSCSLGWARPPYAHSKVLQRKDPNLVPSKKRLFLEVRYSPTLPRHQSPPETPALPALREESVTQTAWRAPSSSSPSEAAGRDRVNGGCPEPTARLCKPLHGRRCSHLLFLTRRDTQTEPRSPSGPAGPGAGRGAAPSRFPCRPAGTFGKPQNGNQINKRGGSGSPHPHGPRGHRQPGRPRRCRGARSTGGRAGRTEPGLVGQVGQCAQRGSGVPAARSGACGAG